MDSMDESQRRFTEHIGDAWKTYEEAMEMIESQRKKMSTEDKIASQAKEIRTLEGKVTKLETELKAEEEAGKTWFNCMNSARRERDAYEAQLKENAYQHERIEALEGDLKAEETAVLNLRGKVHAYEEAYLKERHSNERLQEENDTLEQEVGEIARERDDLKKAYTSQVRYSEEQRKLYEDATKRANEYYEEAREYQKTVEMLVPQLSNAVEESELWKEANKALESKVRSLSLALGAQSPDDEYDESWEVEKLRAEVERLNEQIRSSIVNVSDIKFNEKLVELNIEQITYHEVKNEEVWFGQDRPLIESWNIDVSGKLCLLGRHFVFNDTEGLESMISHILLTQKDLSAKLAFSSKDIRQLRTKYDNLVNELEALVEKSDEDN